MNQAARRQDGQSAKLRNESEDSAALPPCRPVRRWFYWYVCYPPRCPRSWPVAGASPSNQTARCLPSWCSIPPARPGGVEFSSSAPIHPLSPWRISRSIPGEPCAAVLAPPGSTWSSGLPRADSWAPSRSTRPAMRSVGVRLEPGDEFYPSPPAFRLRQMVWGSSQSRFRIPGRWLAAIRTQGLTPEAVRAGYVELALASGLAPLTPDSLGATACTAPWGCTAARRW